MIDGEEVKPTKLELVKAGKGKRKAGPLVNSKQAGAISVRGDEDAPAKPPKVAKGKPTLVKALEVIARQKPKGKSTMDKALVAAKMMAAETAKDKVRKNLKSKIKAPKKKG